MLPVDQSNPHAVFFTVPQGGWNKYGKILNTVVHIYGHLISYCRARKHSEKDNQTELGVRHLPYK